MAYLDHAATTPLRPEVFEASAVDRPEPRGREVLVRIIASSVKKGGISMPVAARADARSYTSWPTSVRSP